MTWDFFFKKNKKKIIIKKKKKKGEHPMYPVQYPCNHTTTKVPGPGPTAKLIETMAQDSVKTKKKKKK